MYPLLFTETPKYKNYKLKILSKSTDFLSTSEKKYLRYIYIISAFFSFSARNSRFKTAARIKLILLPQLCVSPQNLLKFILLLSMGFIFSPFISNGCPISTFTNELSPPLTGNRYGLQVFILEASKANSWKRLTTQIDPIDDDGRFLFFSNNDWKRKNFKKTDRIVYKATNFGRQIGFHDKLPCQGNYIYEVKDETKPNRYAYLTNCPLNLDFSKLPKKIHASNNVHYDSTSGAIYSELYRYSFNKKNHLLFDQIDVGAIPHNRQSIANTSDITIFADVKNFFNLNFDSTDIESYLEEVRVGELSVTAKLSFYLRIFFMFKIKLELSTDVSFYDDSANIPMVMHLPVNPQKYLNPGSGIIYNWVYDDKSTATLGEKIPVLKNDWIQPMRKDKEFIKTIGKNSCSGSSICRYQFTMNTQKNNFSMNFKINKDLVEKGFFPIYIADLSNYNEALNWNLDLDEKKIHSGFFFETSGLEQGSFPWDFWLRLNRSQTPKHHCPHPVSIKTLSKTIKFN